MSDYIDMIKNWIILVAVIAIIILTMGLGCGGLNPLKVVNPLKIDKNPEVISKKTDTLYLPGVEKIVIDTFHHWHSARIENVLPMNPSTDSNRMDLSDTSVFIDPFYYSIKDSVLNATIEITSKEQPLNVSFDYSVLEKEINTTSIRVDTVKIESIEKVRVNQVYVGGTAVVYPSFNAVFANVEFVSKKGWMLGGGVGVMNNAPAVSGSFKWLLSVRKK